MSKPTESSKQLPKKSGIAAAFSTSTFAPNYRQIQQNKLPGISFSTSLRSSRQQFQTAQSSLKVSRGTMHQRNATLAQEKRFSRNVQMKMLPNQRQGSESSRLTLNSINKVNSARNTSQSLKSGQFDNFKTRYNDHLRCYKPTQFKRHSMAMMAHNGDGEADLERTDKDDNLDSKDDFEMKDMGQEFRKDAQEGKPEIKKDTQYIDAVLETSYVESAAKNLKKEDLSEMKMLDPTKKIDDKLKLGTGDDELVDSLVNSAKMGLGAVGTFIPDQQVSQVLKQKKKDTSKLKNKDIKSFVAKRRTDIETRLLDADGLPLVYSQDGIQQFWSDKSGELTGRWAEFLALASPFLLKFLIATVTGKYEQQEASLARDARIAMEKLGPTYIKLGQLLSIRPDIIGNTAMGELKKLQDNVKKFPTSEAYDVLKLEYGIDDIYEVFEEISEEPVAAASLAQVYKAKLKTGETVAVKVQRPGTLELVSKDLYVLRRFSELFQGIVQRFLPTDNSDYIAIFETWAEGFYTELDFVNEAKNQMKFKELVADNTPGIYTPEVYFDYCRRRVLVSEWVDGVKLTESDDEEVCDLIMLGQECFLDQLLNVGFFHCDPHPGNLLKMTDTTKGELCILDYGLMADIPETERKNIVRAIIHVGNRNFSALTDDFIELGFLTEDVDKSIVTPITERVLGPIVTNGSGANYIKKAMKDEVTFSQVTQDLLQAQREVSFQIPPYIALLARAISILEGLALQANPSYKIVMEAYPFVTRKLLADDGQDTKNLLREVMFDNEGRIRPDRLAVLMNQALDIVNKDTDAFIDLDTVPKEGADLDQIVKYILGDNASSIKDTLIEECVEAGDLVLRETARRSFANVQKYSNIRPPLGLPGPKIKVPIPPVFVPGKGLQQADKVVDTLFPQPELRDEVYAQGLLEVILKQLNLDSSILDDPFQPEKYFTAVNQFVGMTRQQGKMGDDEESNQQVVELLMAVFRNNSSTKYTQDEIKQIRMILRDVVSQVRQKVNTRVQLV